MEDISTVIRNKMRRLLLEGIEDEAWSQTWNLVRQPIDAEVPQIRRQIKKELTDERY